MSSPQESLVAMLKQAKKSITKVRLAVFAALEEQGPLTMHQLVAKLPGADRASVYRAVALFERLGIVQRLNIGWKYQLELSDKFAAHHHHLSCTRCGRTTALSEAELERFIERLARQHHFLPTAHQLEIQGACQNCQTR